MALFTVVIIGVGATFVGLFLITIGVFTCAYCCCGKYRVDLNYLLRKQSKFALNTKLLV